MSQKRIIAIAVVLLAGGLLVWSFFSDRNPPLSPLENGGRVTASLTIDFGDDKEQFRDVVLTTDPTAFGILKTATEREGIPLVFDPPASMGVFIRQIGDKKNGDGGRYWQYWVNEKFPLVAADRSVLEAGDLVEWKFVAQP